jgi:hypothetical protein
MRTDVYSYITDFSILNYFLESSIIQEWIRRYNFNSVNICNIDGLYGSIVSVDPLNTVSY